MQVLQKRNVVIQGCKDIIICLNQILKQYQQSVIDYAKWYSEMNKNTDTYSDYITLVTCHSIIHSEFLRPNVRWKVIKFQDEENLISKEYENPEC